MPSLADLHEQGPVSKFNATSESTGERSYALAIRSGALGLLRDVLSQSEFLDSLYAIVLRGLTGAFREGFTKAKVDPENLNTPDYLPERMALDKLILDNQARIIPFTSYILQQRQDVYNQGKKALAIQHVVNRTILWANQYDKARQEAYTMVSGDAPQIWIYGDTVRHCDSCSTYEGRIYRASTWAAHGAIPKSSRLCCEGWRCLCKLEPAPPGSRITPGRFPESALCN